MLGKGKKRKRERQRFCLSFVLMGSGFEEGHGGPIRSRLWVVDAKAVGIG
jgi:hypothetical protein